MLQSKINIATKEQHRFSGLVTRNGVLKTWIVYLNGVMIDVVWMPIAFSALSVKQTLLYRDGYHKDITLGLPH